MQPGVGVRLEGPANDTGRIEEHGVDWHVEPCPPNLLDRRGTVAERGWKQLSHPSGTVRSISWYHLGFHRPPPMGQGVAPSSLRRVDINLSGFCYPSKLAHPSTPEGPHRKLQQNGTPQTDSFCIDPSTRAVPVHASAVSFQGPRGVVASILDVSGASAISCTPQEAFGQIHLATLPSIPGPIGARHCPRRGSQKILCFRRGALSCGIGAQAVPPPRGTSRTGFWVGSQMVRVP